MTNQDSDKAKRLKDSDLDKAKGGFGTVALTGTAGTNGLTGTAGTNGITGTAEGIAITGTAEGGVAITGTAWGHGVNFDSDDIEGIG